MQRNGLICVLAVLVMGLDGVAVEAGSAPSFSIKADFGVSSFPSDENITTGYYLAEGSDPVNCRADGQMTYHFDRKFGRSGHGALCYELYPNVQFEIGFGYTSMQMEITQHGKALLSGGCWPELGVALYDFNTRKDSDVSYFNVRPGVSYFLSTKSRVVPYVSLGLDIMRMSAKANVDFPELTVEQQGTTHVLVKRDGEVELNGSDMAFGVDIGSGLEIRATQMLSIVFGFSYMVQFARAFPDFRGLMTAGSSATARSVQYYNEGMTISNIGATIGIRAYL
jgi:hypothetical protein